MHIKAFNFILVFMAISLMSCSERQFKCKNESGKIESVSQITTPFFQSITTGPVKLGFCQKQGNQILYGISEYNTPESSKIGACGIGEYSIHSVKFDNISGALIERYWDGDATKTETNYFECTEIKD